MRVSIFLIIVLFAYQTFACQFKAGVREFPPYTYQMNNQWQGFDIQVLTQLVLSLNCQITFPILGFIVITMGYFILLFLGNISGIEDDNEIIVRNGGYPELVSYLM